MSKERVCPHCRRLIEWHECQEPTEEQTRDDLIEQAARAEEVFPADELEEFANAKRKVTD